MNHRVASGPRNDSDPRPINSFVARATWTLPCGGRAAPQRGMPCAYFPQECGKRMLHGSRPWQGIPRREAPETRDNGFISNNTEKQTLRLAGRAIENARRFAPMVYGAPHHEWRESEVQFLARGIYENTNHRLNCHRSVYLRCGAYMPTA